MSAAKHSEAPWRVTDTGVRNSGGYICHTNSVTRYEGQDERYEREVAERAADKQLIAAAPRLFDALETLVDALATGAGRDFLEAFVRDGSAALEAAQPGWNKLDELTASDLRKLADVRAAAPELFEALAVYVAYDEYINGAAGDPSTDRLQKARAAVTKATGAAA